MTGYDPETFEAAALTGDWKAAVAVRSRSTVRPEAMEALISPDARLDVVLGVMGRPDVTPERPAWAATFDNAQILGRVVSNPKTPTPVIREIRDRWRTGTPPFGCTSGSRPIWCWHDSTESQVCTAAVNVFTPPARHKNFQTARPSVKCSPARSSSFLGREH